ncbi:MAG: tetratricopeptide repeat protein [Brevinematales bacterium]|nr:tetratricopeptide repeat protein [Brevinematales bacterium]
MKFYHRSCLSIIILLILSIFSVVSCLPPVREVSGAGEVPNPANYAEFSEYFKALKKLDRPGLIIDAITGGYPGGVPLIYLDDLARAQWETGQYRAALSNYVLWMQTGGGKHVKAMIGIAKCYREMGEYAHAAAYFELALSASPTFWNYYEYGKLYERMGLYEKAAEMYGSAYGLSSKVQYVYRSLICDKLAGAYFKAAQAMADADDKNSARAYLSFILDDPLLRQTYAGEKAEFWMNRW